MSTETNEKNIYSTHVPTPVDEIVNSDIVPSENEINNSYAMPLPKVLM